MMEYHKVSVIRGIVKGMVLLLITSLLVLVIGGCATQKAVYQLNTMERPIYIYKDYHRGEDKLPFYTFIDKNGVYYARQIKLSLPDTIIVME